MKKTRDFCDNDGESTRTYDFANLNDLQNLINGRLDVMIPREYEGTLTALETKIQVYINDYNLANNLTLTFNVGFFDH